MLLQTLCHPSFLRLPLGCWQTIKHPLYGKPCRVHFAFGGWERRNERTAARRKIQLPLQAQSEVCSRPKRNKWRGPAAGGEVAVYAGFGLEQTQRSARRVDLTTPTLAIKLSQEPNKVLSCKLSKERGVSTKSPPVWVWFLFWSTKEVMFYIRKRKT